LETQHEVIDISHHAGLTTKSWLDHSLEPQIEHIVEIYITQQYADYPSYTIDNFQFEHKIKLIRRPGYRK
jgi:hypothetical protein